jgi:hypothetical protein
VRVRRDQLVLGAVAAALLVAIVVFAATSSSVKTDGSPTPTPTATATPASERDLFGGSLEPRVRYHTRAFLPPLSFVVGDTEWLVTDATQTNQLVLERRVRTGAPGSELPSRSSLIFSRVVQVLDHRSGVPMPVDDLYPWLRRHPDLVVGPAEPVTIAGTEGERFDAIVRFRRPAHPDPACRRLLIVCTSVIPGIFYPDGLRIRMIVLHMDGPPFLIQIVGLTQRDRDKVAAPAMEVLRTLRIGLTRP